MILPEESWKESGNWLIALALAGLRDLQQSHLSSYGFRSLLRKMSEWKELLERVHRMVSIYVGISAQDLWQWGA